MRRSFAWWGVLVVLACAWGPLAVASEGTAESQAVIRFHRLVLNLGGEMRLVALRLGAIPVATVDPGVADQVPTEESLAARLRWRPSLTWQVPSRVVPVVAVLTEVDLLDGMAFAGPDREVLASSRASRVRQDLFEAANLRLNAAYLLVHSPYFTFLGGRQKSHAGLGMVANDGNDRPEDVGVRRLGDIVDRALISVRLLRFFSDAPSAGALSVAAGFDHVERDLFADRDRDDRAYQAVAVVQYEPPIGRIGATYLHRWQRNSLGDRTRFHLVDVFADLALKAGDVTLGVAGEWALARGFTEVPRSLQNPDGVDVASSGMVLRASLSHPLGRVVIEAGRASGDADPYDGTYAAFTMNPDYRVGLILFHEVLKATSAVSAWNGSRTWFQGQPPRGLQALPTDGGVQNAVYANPRVALTVIPHLELLVGLLVARADTPLVDPFWLNVAGRTGGSGCAVPGGQAPGPRCGPASRDLGYEVDLAARGRFRLGPIGLLAAMEYSYFRPGAAFADAGGNEPSGIHLVQGRVHVTW